MADFIDSEAEESEEEEELTEKERSKLKKIKAAAIDSDDEDEDDDEQMQEELGDLIDDNPIEDDSSSSESDNETSGGTKRKRDDDDDELDDRLSEEDFELIEENLGIKMKRKKNFVRVKRIVDDESDEEGEERGRDAIANELFEGSDGEDSRRAISRTRQERNEEENFDKYSDEEDEDEEDIGDFIVDAEGQPIHGKKKKRKAIYTDAALQEAQDIFGVDFDYEDFNQEGEEYEEDEEEEEYEDEEGVRKMRKKPGQVVKKKSQRKTIYDVYEPSELERGHFTDFDEKIRKTDMPERMQLRNVPISSVDEGSAELDLEAEWIYKHAFSKPSISNQEGNADGREKVVKGPQTVEKIRKALEFMRNQHFEVPFIAFYRKEYVLPELSVNDLWRVYKFDEKWTQLQTRKKNMMGLFRKMQKYQSEKLTQNLTESIPENVRVLKDEDSDRLRVVQSIEELSDVYNHFVLYYGADVPAMQEEHRRKAREEAKERRSSAARRRLNEDGEPIDVDDLAEDLRDAANLDEASAIKQATRSDLYSLCARAGLDGLLRKYGLSPEQFAENMRDNYQRHEVDQTPTEPFDVALEYVSTKFPTATEVLKAANYMMAVQIAKEPLVRQCVREAFFERARIDVIPTKQGLKEIDENHHLYPMKFLKDKPVRDLADDQFLRLVVAEQDKLLTIVFQTKIEGATTPSYVDEVKALFTRDEFSKLVQEWNDLRNEVIDLALNKFVFPALVKELKAKLLSEAREFVMRACCHQLYNWLKVAPYKVDFDDEEEWDTKNGIRVMALSYVADLDQAAFGCLINVDGECSDHIRLEHILKRKNAWKEIDRAGKERDLNMLRNFIFSKKPHVIAVSAESREATMLIEDLRAITAQLVEDEQWPMINVELVDNSLGKVFANSTRAETEFREYPLLLREAISIARGLQDPLIEYSQLCNTDEEIVCLKYHELQDQLSKEELLEGLYTEFVNRTNEVGVDINRAINYPHTANLVQFVCGLGPRKGQALIKILKQNNQRLENRTQLVTACHMGPKVFINCAGFIKIDTNSLGDSTESYVEVLDGSRVHPETYEWARKMAVDALEYDDEDANPAGAVEEILEAPERLKDLDLDAFADELERQGFGNKRITLYDIRSELNHRYKDGRPSYQAPSPEEIFNMVTKETPQTFFIGKLVMATVTGFQHRKPKREELDRANPNRNEATGLWQCPFCLQNDFTDLSEVWNHFDAGSCSGQAIGVRIRLENGLSGFIPMKCLSDSEVTNPEDRVRPGQTIHCRITKIDVERFSVAATCKSSDLMDKNGEWRPPKDAYYDTSAEEAIVRAEEDSKKLKHRQSYTKRVIVHPSFKNIGFKEAEKLMASMDQGEVIVRPSSKGTNHLTVTWKVGEGICQHVDIREEGKENAFSLGQSLMINDEEFEDLDEIIARHINPMAGHARDLYAFRYFRDLGISEENYAPGKERERAEEIIKDDKKKNPAKIHYFVSASREFPGKFMLTYLPRTTAKHEYITVTSEGFRFRGQVHDSLASLFRWFKEHFRDPIPGTPSSRAGGGGHHTSGSSSRTPGYGGTGTTPNVNPETLHRVAQSIPANMLHSLSQVAHFQGTPTPFGYPANTPYTPSGQTPFMTPFATTPHQPQTPRYSGAPAPNAAPSAGASQGTFRTPAAPGAHRGYGSQNHSSSPFNRQSSGSNRPSSQSSSRGASESWDAVADDWGLGSTANGSKTSTSRSAAPAGSEPDDWNAATNAWGSVTSNRTAAKTTPNSRPSASGAAAAGDDWGASADAWASSGGNSTSRGRTTPSASRAGASTDDWGASSKPSGSSSNPSTPKTNSSSKSGGSEDWGAKADAWASSKGRTTTSSSKGDDWGSSGSSSSPWATGANAAPRGGRTPSRGGSKSSTSASSQSTAVDDWGLSNDTPAAPPATTTPRSGASTANDDWASEADAFASGSKSTTPRAAPTPSSSGADEWASGSSSKASTTPSATKADDPWGSISSTSGSGGGGSYGSRGTGGSYGSRGGGRGGGGGGGGGRPCYNCQEEGHMSKDCPKPRAGGGRGRGGGGGSVSCYNCNEDGHLSRDCPKPSTRGGGRGGGSVSCYNCNEDGHISRDCPKPSSRGGGRGGGGSRACYRCNEEGHMSVDCPKGGGGGRSGSSRSRSSTASANDDRGSTSSPWATGANAAPRGSGRASSSASKSNDDDWGASVPPRSGDRASPSARKSNDDDWGIPAPPSGAGRSTPSARKSTDDDWGAAADSWASTTGKSGGDKSRSSRSAAAPASSGDSWDTAVTSKGSASRGDDDWGTSISAPGTTPRSSDGRRSSRQGGRSPRQMEMGDATPLYDE
ncbi:hypothetical protein OUZ56_013534 [Daphnia magna]|uniref:Transcription elongation factor spt6 n=1 Tax=Daphnia magna TaxID=35525 RepID=A0ABQ9Z659_9CRUS|nr:hypothetical protein OUZ56_013534 [Daphnia magna]